MHNSDANDSRVRLLVLCCGAVVAAFAAVFLIPWRIPLSHVAVGESYALAFNNRSAVIGFGLVICGLAAGLLFLARAGDRVVDARHWIRAPEDIWPHCSDTETRIDLLVLLGACIAMSQLILWWDSQLAVPYWGEADYFLSRIDLVALGARPYVDFSFLYGPATLYGPYWLDRLSYGTLGLERAYAWTVVGSYVGGFACNYLVLRSLVLPRNWRPLLLATCCIMWAPLTMGLQYTPLRFMFVPSVLTLLHGASAPSCAGTKREWFIPAVSLAGTGFAFLLFPEMGVVCSMASLAFAALLALGGRLQPAAFVAIGLAVMVLLVHLAFPGYFDGMRSFVKGAMNFPIYPNVHNLMLVCVGLFVIATSAATSLSHSADVRAPFLAATAAANTLLLSPSLGRCDPGHVGLNSSMLFLTMFAVAATYGRRWFMAWLGTFVLAFVLLNQVSYWGIYLGTFRQALAISRFYATNPQAVLAWHTAWERRAKENDVPAALNWRRTAPFPDWATHGMMAQGATLPLGGDIGLDRFVKTQAGYRPPFHPPPKPDLHVPEDVARADLDARHRRLIILPEYAYAAATAANVIEAAAYEQQVDRFLTGLMIFPVHCRMKNTPFIPEAALCKPLVADGDVVATGAGYVILRLRSP